MPYVYTIPSSPCFTDKGLKGYQFGPLRNQEVEIHFVDVKKGHDTFFISKRLTRFYYILEGKGYFTIENTKYDVEPGMLVEVPPNIEYSYSGSMKLLLIGNPRWFKGNEEVTKKNPDVFSGLSISSISAKLGFEKRYFSILRMAKIWLNHSNV